MEAVEYIIRKGQRPQRTFFMAFGHDEEVSFNFMVIIHYFVSEK
jgi:acetylornithine deacetylase/succinyl-diaminopimelate desuccinylase-like protein